MYVAFIFPGRLLSVTYEGIGGRVVASGAKIIIKSDDTTSSATAEQRKIWHWKNVAEYVFDQLYNEFQMIYQDDFLYQRNTM
jgi:DNA repair protein RadC